VRVLGGNLCLFRESLCLTVSRSPLAMKEATSNQRGTRAPTLGGGYTSPSHLNCSQTSLFAWCNLDYPPLMVISGQDNGSSQSSGSSSTGNAPSSNTSPPNGSDDPSGSGPPAVPPIDDLSTKSMNVTKNINGVTGLESHKTVNRKREEHHPSYASKDADGNAPSGEHLAVFVAPFRVSHHGQKNHA
jgi:hypothetical protein